MLSNLMEIVLTMNIKEKIQNKVYIFIIILDSPSRNRETAS